MAPKTSPANDCSSVQSRSLTLFGLSQNDYSAHFKHEIQERKLGFQKDILINLPPRYTGTVDIFAYLQNTICI